MLTESSMKTKGEETASYSYSRSYIQPAIYIEDDTRRKKLTNNNNIKLKTALQELVLNLLCNRVETDVGLSPDFFRHYSMGYCAYEGKT